MRIAWLVSFLVPAILLVLLFAARPAAALPAVEAAPEFVEILGDAEEELSNEEGEEESEEEAGEEGEEEASEGSAAPEECRLRSAAAEVFSRPGQSKLQLVIRYTSFSSAAVTIDYRLTGGKGSLHFPVAHRHFGKQGRVSLTTRLNDREIEQVEAAHSFTVVLHIPNAPSGCSRFFTSHLNVKHGGPKRATWLPGESP